MAKLTIPHVRGREKAIFDKLGITLIESMKPEEFEAMMIDFLSNHNVLHLATCKNNEPRCTPLEYFNVGLDVHVFSEGGGKIVNIKNNPLVSFGISEPFDPLEDFFASTGLQVWGTASIFRKNGIMQEPNFRRALKVLFQTDQTEIFDKPLLGHSGGIPLTFG